jgi:hypothetical protein
MRLRLLALASLALPAVAVAQGAAKSAKSAKPAANAKPVMPGRWQMRLDRANLPSDYKVAAAGAGYHVTTGRAAGVVYDPRMTATGAYRLDATFTQTKAPAHPEAYGLIFGGKALDTEAAEYFYYVVRGDAKYLVKHRAPNGDVHTLVDWTASPALHAADAAGKATNALRVEVGADSLRLFANGARVAALPRVTADGVYGLRVNHALDVNVENLKVSK